MTTYKEIKCQRCGSTTQIFSNPAPTVDIIIEIEGRIVLIERKNPPIGWALPGGFVDYGEAIEHAAVREAKEETGLDIELICMLGCYSDPRRDARGHTISSVFVARANGEPLAGDDAATAQLFDPNNIAVKVVFDHDEILKDYTQYLNGKRTACMIQHNNFNSFDKEKLLETLDGDEELMQNGIRYH